MDSIKDVIDRYSKEIMSLPGVVGVGIGLKTVGGRAVEPHQYVIMVYVLNKQNINDVSIMLEGYPVQIEVTGEIVAS